jgi:Tol biopolymer transport system component
LPLDGDRKPFPVAQTSFDEVHAQFSPDGHWIAHASNETGRYEVYLQAFPKSAVKRRVSTESGIYPRWRRDGRELYYVTLDNRLVAVPIQTHMITGGTVGPTGVLSKAPYAVGSDGRFLILVSADDNSSTPINLVLNWPAALKK